MNVANPKEQHKAKTEDQAAAPGTALSTDVDYDYGEHAGAGLQNIDSSEMMIPFLRILQALSPQVQPPEQGGLAGAKAGMILNTATNEMWPGAKGLHFYPVERDHNFVKYVPRTAGGGFLGIEGPKSELVAELRKAQGNFGKLTLPDGNEMQETFYLYGLVAPEGGFPQRVMVGFASTQIKRYKAMLMRAGGLVYEAKNADGTTREIRPPLWGHRWRLAVVPDSNKKGKFFSWSPTLDLPVVEEGKPQPSTKLALVSPKDPLFKLCADFSKLIRDGKITANYAAAAGEAAEADAGREGAATGPAEDPPY